MQTATTDVLYFETGPDNQPTLRVSPGEEFEVRTQINRGPWLDDHPDREALLTKLHGGNPSSGCIYVDGAEPGQDLIVHIGEIEVDPVGFTNYGGSTGAMPGWLGDSGVGRHHKVVRIEDGQILWSERLKIPIAPMLGFVGVAPKNTRWHNGWAGEWGGNFDIPEVTTGASVRLPISVPGALLHIGDMHARQGDGEICGAGGIEAGGRVRIRCELAPHAESMGSPRITNDTHIIGDWHGAPGRGRVQDGAVRDDRVARRRLRLRERRGLPVPRPSARGPMHPVREPHVLLRGESRPAVPGVNET